jgi:protoporphyrinogen IX oxidase
VVVAFCCKLTHFEFWIRKPAPKARNQGVVSFVFHNVLCWRSTFRISDSEIRNPKSEIDMYFYLKAVHIIFIVTWFSGMFYIVRLFIYNTEANTKPELERNILQQQFNIMIKRLWLGITWPSAILTLVFGPLVLFQLGNMDTWMWIKLALVLGLYLYHFSLQKIYNEQQKGIFRYTSNRLRVWNEVATVLLVAIVMLASVKSNMSFVWGLAGLVVFVVLLMGAIRVYKKIRGER